MTNASGTYGARASGSDDGWSQARPVRPSDPHPSHPVPTASRDDRDPQYPRSRSTPRVVVPAPDTQQRPSPRPNGTPDRRVDPAPQSNRWEPPQSPAEPRHAPATAWQQLRETAAADQVQERGLPGWAALLVLLAIAGVGGLIDMINGTHVRGGFNIGIIVASVVAILVVRRSAMFPVVVAPPIVYSAASGFLLYVRSGGLHDRKVLIDTAANWLVYGFPAIAAATAAVLIIAGIRIIIRR